jgi:hypothetical protein
MPDDSKAPAERSEPSAFEKMKEFTRRLIAVPKSELPSRTTGRQGKAKRK